MENPLRKFFRKKEKEDLSYRSGLSAEQRERFGLNETLDVIDQAILDKLLPSDDLKGAFDNMRAKTFPTIPATNVKREVVLEVLNKNLLDKASLEKGDTVYVGAGDDIEYPILLGARNIILVDSGFESGSGFIDAIKQKIESTFKSSELNVDGNVLTFQLDIGAESKETIKIKADFKHVKMGALDVSDRDRYVPENQISLLMNFNSGGDIDQDPDLVEKVIPGGYILPDRIMATDEEMLKKGYEITPLSAEKTKGRKVFRKIV